MIFITLSTLNVIKNIFPVVKYTGKKDSQTYIHTYRKKSLTYTIANQN